jgi:hypothetical protein
MESINNVYGLDQSDDGGQSGFFGRGVSSASASAPRVIPATPDQQATPPLARQEPDRRTLVERIEAGIQPSPPLVSFLTEPVVEDEENTHAGRSQTVSPEKGYQPDGEEHGLDATGLSELPRSKLSGKHGYYKARRAITCT